MDQTKSLKRSRDSPLHSPTTQPLTKRTKVIPDHEVIVIEDLDEEKEKESIPGAPVHCLLDEEPDAAGFYHCIRVSGGQLQPSDVASRVEKASAYPSPVKSEILDVNDTDHDSQNAPADTFSPGRSDEDLPLPLPLPNSPAPIASPGEFPDTFIQLPDQTWVRLTDIDLTDRWVLDDDDTLIRLE